MHLRSLQHHLTAVGRDVEVLHFEIWSQVGQLMLGARVQIDPPEIFVLDLAPQHHQRSPSSQEAQMPLVSGVVGGVGRAAVRTAKDQGAIVIAGVRKKQLDAAKSIGADELVALDDQAAFDALAPVDIVANTVHGGTAEQLVSKVK